nr:extracellular serine/threonine protein kinase FAM20C-like [Lytechinus pictus]
MKLRWRFMFWGTIFVCCTTLMTIFAVLREVGAPVAARVESIHRNFKKTLENTSIMDGINLLTSKERAVPDHQNASTYDAWVAGKRRERPNWVSSGSKDKKNGTHLLPWQQFHADINENQMYSRNAPYMKDLLESLATTEIVDVGLFHGGSQLKLHVKLADGNYAMLKPMRTPRSLVYNYDEEQPFWLDIERHNAEIAAFHLDRILNFRRSPPCAGRVLNITADIKMKTKDKDLLNSFFRDGGNTCFEGKCAPWFCNKDHPVCGRGEMLEVSLCVMIPFYHGNEDPIFDRPNPWSHGIREAQIWQEQNICEEILKNSANAEGRFLLDLVEQSIFDFLMLNYDRHHFHMLYKYGSKGFVVALDNGKGFGNPYLDDLNLLGPLAQCCIIRDSTFKYLLKVNGSREKLSDHMKHTLVKDLIDPVIHETHLEAIDRRLMKLLDLIGDCVNLYGEKRVMVKGKLDLPFPEVEVKMDM